MAQGTAIAATEANPADNIAMAHGLDWVRAPPIDPPLNGNVPFCQWSVKSVVRDISYPGGPMNGQQVQMSTLDNLLLMFPLTQLSAMLQLTNVQLH
jgi:hypothetical protein